MAGAKFGISPDGKTFVEEPLAASSIVDTDGTTAQQHMDDTTRHTTAADKTKLNGIAVGAQVNIIESVKRNGAALAISGKTVDVTVPTKTSDLTHDSGFLTSASPLDASKLAGVVPIASIPPAALERMTTVATDAARLALTTATVQTGDTVKVTGTDKMYLVKDDTKLSSEDGYEPYTAGSASSVPWIGVTGKPTTVSGYGITDAPTANLTTATQAEAEAGSAATVRAWTPQRVRQAADKAAVAAVLEAGIDIVVVSNENEIATSGVRPGGIVLMKV